MVKVGLVGEDPNDTTSIMNLLNQKYSGKVKFENVARGVKGHQLDTDKLKRTIKFECRNKPFAFIIYIRDLDGLISHTTKIVERRNWFECLNSEIAVDGILLLNIWELEALILADIETFNKIYKIKHKFKGDPTLQANPKEILKQLTFKQSKQFKESHCPEVFKELSFDVVTSRCGYFKLFVEELDAKLLLN